MLEWVLNTETAYYIFTSLLKVVDVFEYAFNVFGGVADVTLTKNGVKVHDFLLNVLFTNSGVSKSFWGITIFAFIISVIFSIVAVVRANLDTENKRTLGRVFGSIGKTAITFLIIPTLTLLILNLANIAIRKANEAITYDGSESCKSLGSVIFLTSAVNESEGNNFLADKYAGYYTGEKDYLDIEVVNSDFSLSELRLGLGIIIALFLIMMMIMCSFVFILRIFEVMLLYLISPFFVVTMPMDNGEKFGEWRKMFIVKLCSGFGMVIAMKIYLLIVPMVLTSGLEFSGIQYVDLALKIILICGGAFAVYKSNVLVTQIVGMTEKKGEKEAIENNTVNEIMMRLKGGEKEGTAVEKGNLWQGDKAENLYTRLRK